MATSYAIVNKNYPYRILKRCPDYEGAIESANEVFNSSDEYLILYIEDGRVVSVMPQEPEQSQWI